MHALHSTLLPPSAVHHSLYLPNFTPSTIYPLPASHDSSAPEIKVVGNLIVAGGEDLRVFEIRESQRPLPAVNGVHDEAEPGELKVEDEDYFDTGPSERAPVQYETTRKLHLLTRHQVHGTVTGLAALRTIESSADGLDRLLVSFKDAKMVLLEWSRGDIATVSLHTYERCSQMVNGDLQSYVPLLRSDPLSRLAVLTLPEDSLAVLPLTQEQSDLDPLDTRDVPYFPSFVLSLRDVSPSLKNLQDLLFLPGFHSPTLALLYSPVQTWSGRYKTARDTFVLEIRTIDLSSGSSYPLLTSVTGLPADSLYLVACPIGGVVLVTCTGIIHIDQSGRITSAGVNAWWSYTTALKADRSSEERKLSLEGSKCVFVTDHDMLLVLHNGDAHQVRFEMDGRAVGTIKVDEQCSEVPPPSSIVVAGDKAVFVGCAEGDSLLAKVEAIRKMIRVEETKTDMDVDWDEDLYGEMTDSVKEVPSGPARIHVSTYDVLAGVGKIIDMEFGIAVTDQGVRTYPQLVTIGGGTKRSTFNVFRRGIPITKRRRFNELVNTEAAWFLPIQRQSVQKLKDIPDAERTTLLFSSEATQTRIFALSTRATPEQIGRIGSITLAAAPFFGRSCVVHVSPSQVTLLDSDGKLQQVVSQGAFASASISDPYIVVRQTDGTSSLFVGDGTTRQVSETPLDPCQGVEVFSDVSGIYRTFEAGASAPNRIRATRMQLTQQQIKELQQEKPAIAEDSSMEQMKGTKWLASIANGVVQIRSLPDLQVVLESEGVCNSEPSFTDDYTGTPSDLPDTVRQFLFHPIGKENPRPHVTILFSSGKLNIYEAQPRFTVDSSLQSRRSLAVRFRRVHTQVLPPTSTLVPFTNIEGYTGLFITGEKPHWVLSSDAHPIRSFGLKQAAVAFGKTTHLGGTGEYFMRIEDGSFICYFPPTLNTDFTIPCDRHVMERNYTNIAFDPLSAHYVASAAIAVPFQAYDEEGEIQVGPENSDERLLPPTNERSTLELFSAGSDPWRVIDGHDFDQNEQVLCMQSVILESSSVPTGYRDFIAVGTGFDFGEDRATRGNLYVFEVVEIVSEGGKTSWQLVKRAKDPARNPVSSINNINGYLLNSNGPKMYAKGLDYDRQLMGLAFLDVNFYVTSIRVFKNFILISDLVKSVWLVSLNEDPYRFTHISKDLSDVSLVSSEFLVHERRMAFVTVDRQGNMRMLEFDPNDSESLNGEKLLLRTEYHVGSPITASKSIARRKSPEEMFAPQTQIVYATADGSLTTVVSVKEARYKRLQLVSDQLVRNALHVAGLNPRTFRTVKNDLVPKPLTKGILDGNLLSHFALQPVKRQQEMLRQIGTDELTVDSDLQAIGGFW
ncbi:cleavage and polyadenylation specific protein [Kockovaella imperatae]|uniref:Cleavage and polyadenylation specific protein n=1 Tax=Kockovaella imperatae TaxID=4999 RepID=A0A1Y1UMD3_9TREE|nr:cleavage and polyadenylation specific protein [Kockovaella imperatae]ORX39210.1 cleavage and polyadenylation specific protein [Kockovaella imperatae]